VVAHVFHVPAAARVERVEQGVVAPVELERADADALAEGLVEDRRGLHPRAVEVQLGIAVVVEDVGGHHPAQARARQVVPDVREADARGNVRGARGGGEERRLAHAEAGAAGEAAAGPVGLDRLEVAVGGVGDLVPHRVVERHGPGHRVRDPIGHAAGEGDDSVRVGVDVGGRPEKLVQRAVVHGHRSLSDRAAGLQLADAGGTSLDTAWRLFHTPRQPATPST
jgi:hypothetical protein